MINEDFDQVEDIDQDAGKLDLFSEESEKKFLEEIKQEETLQQAQ